MSDTNAIAAPVEISDAQLAKMLSGETAEPATEPNEPVAQEPSSAAAPADGEKPAAGSDPVKPQEPKEEDDETTKPGLKKRFRQLTGENRALKERLDRLEASAPKSDPGNASPAATPKVDDKEPVLPDLETFKGTYAEYQKALQKGITDLTQYHLKRADAERVQKDEQKTVEQRHKDQAKVWNDAEAALMKRPERADYAEVADSVQLPPDSAASPAIAQAIQQAPNGPELLYHLGKNPAVVEKLAGMKPLAAVLELGVIAASLIPAPKTKVPDVPLPKPPQIPGGGAAPAEFDPNDKDLSQEAFNQWMEKGEKRRGRR